jgi:N-acetylglucosamine repressor
MPSGAAATASLLRQLNANQVLATLQNHGPMSRAEISRQTGISSPTITRAVSNLLQARLLEEGELHQPALGRPGKVLRLASRSVGVLGLVIGVQQAEFVAAGLDGQLLPDCTVRFPTPARYDELLEQIVRLARRHMSGSESCILGLGISVPGLLSRGEKRTLVSPNLHQLDGRQLGEDLGAALGLEVALLQESHALCLAEQTYGAARGIADFAMIDISDGLGLGVIAQGRFLEGHSGLAGELGHVTVDLDGPLCGCGNRGCLETLATDKALVQALSARFGRPLTIDEALVQLASGALHGEAEIAQVVRYLAVGLAAVINLFNPSKLFVYGRLFDAGPGVFADLLASVARRALAPSLRDCEIIRAHSHKRLGAVAGIIRRLTIDRDAPWQP